MALHPTWGTVLFQIRRKLFKLCPHCINKIHVSKIYQIITTPHKPQRHDNSHDYHQRARTLIKLAALAATGRGEINSSDASTTLTQHIKYQLDISNTMKWTINYLEPPSPSLQHAFYRLQRAAGGAAVWKVSAYEEIFESRFSVTSKIRLGGSVPYLLTPAEERRDCVQLFRVFIILLNFFRKISAHFLFI